MDGLESTVILKESIPTNSFEVNLIPFDVISKKLFLFSLLDLVTKKKKYHCNFFLLNYKNYPLS